MSFEGFPVSFVHDSGDFETGGGTKRTVHLRWDHEASSHIMQLVAHIDRYLPTQGYAWLAVWDGAAWQQFVRLYGDELVTREKPTRFTERTTDDIFAELLGCAERLLA
jgi:hypothetical protein